MSVNEDYFGQFRPHQRAKHEIVKRYLQGWFPKMGLGPYAKKLLLVFDTHAGRGRHTGGEEGSPLVIVRSLLNHRACEEVLTGTEVRFIFQELDDENVEQLRDELKDLDLPKGVIVEVEEEDSFKALEELLDSLDDAGKNLAPAFLLIDPYSFKVPGDVLKRLMAHKGVEILLNVIWRELDMSLGKASNNPENGLCDLMDELFLEEDWRGEINREDEIADRGRTVLELLKNAINARWCTYMKMMENGRVKYYLAHFTNHEEGRRLIKDTLWKVDPEGGFTIYQSDSPGQGLLVGTDPDIEPVIRWLEETLGNNPRSNWEELREFNLDSIYRDTHLWKAMRQGLKNSCICQYPETGKVTQGSGHRFALPD